MNLGCFRLRRKKIGGFSGCILRTGGPAELVIAGWRMVYRADVDQGGRKKWQFKYDE
jgi:hypothetical protein